MLVTWTGPTTVVTEFFDGMGRAYSFVIGIIIAAGVFIGGLEAAGVIKSLDRDAEGRQVAPCRSWAPSGPSSWRCSAAPGMRPPSPSTPP